MLHQLKTVAECSKAFVIGNGNSRRDFDLNQLKKKGITYGCNALYRDFAPDFLYAVDDKIIMEILDSGYTKNNVFFPRHLPDGYEHSLVYRDHPGWATGPGAMFDAIRNGHKELYMIGFDISSGYYNNHYADTRCYQSTGSKETFFGNWVNQITTLIKNNPTVNIHRVQDSGFIPDEFKEYQNVNHLTYSEFIQQIV